MRRLIIDEMPTNPKYFQRMSEILSELVEKRKREDIEYKEYLRQITELSKQVKHPEAAASYPEGVNTRGLQALYDNLDDNAETAVRMHTAIMEARTDGWRGNRIKERRIRNAIKEELGYDDTETERLFEIIVSQHEY